MTLKPTLKLNDAFASPLVWSDTFPAGADALPTEERLEFLKGWNEEAKRLGGASVSDCARAGWQRVYAMRRRTAADPAVAQMVKTDLDGLKRSVGLAWPTPTTPTPTPLGGDPMNEKIAKALGLDPKASPRELHDAFAKLVGGVTDVRVVMTELVEEEMAASKSSFNEALDRVKRRNPHLVEQLAEQYRG